MEWWAIVSHMHACFWTVRKLEDPVETRAGNPS